MPWVKQSWATVLWKAKIIDILSKRPLTGPAFKPDKDIEFSGQCRVEWSSSPLYLRCKGSGFDSCLEPGFLPQNHAKIKANVVHFLNYGSQTQRGFYSAIAIIICIQRKVTSFNHFVSPPFEPVVDGRLVIFSGRISVRSVRPVWSAGASRPESVALTFHEERLLDEDDVVLKNGLEWSCCGKNDVLVSESLATWVGFLYIALVKRK